MLESEFKKEFIERIRSRLPEVDLDFIHTKPYNRSKPDLVILGPIRWATLEFKKTKRSKQQPNQEYHILRMDAKGYARFVYPSNSEEVLDELERLFSY